MRKLIPAALGTIGLLAAALVAAPIATAADDPVPAPTPTKQAPDFKAGDDQRTPKNEKVPNLKAAKAGIPVFNEYDASWTESWRNGIARGKNATAPQGINGASRFTSQFGFGPELHSDLVALKKIDPTTTIDRVDLIMTNEWWVMRTGAADIGVHGSATAPAVFKYSGSLTSGNWTTGYGRVVQLPGTWMPGFNTGTTKGVTLGGKVNATSNTNDVFIGRMHSSYGPVYAQTPFVRVHYKTVTAK